MHEARKVEVMAKNFLSKRMPSMSTAASKEISGDRTKDDIIRDFSKLAPADRAALLRSLSLSSLPDSYEGLFVPGFAPKGHPDHEAAKLFEFEGLVNSQSIGFMTELIPYLYPILLDSGQTLLEVLDVGTRTGAGTALLSDLFQTYHSRAQLAIDTIDIDPTFVDYQNSRYWNLRRAFCGDIFDLKAESYDLIICSHTIEHIPDPIPFVRQLQKIAKLCAVFYCPYEENPCIPGHFPITQSLLDEMGAQDQKIVNSWWFQKDQTGPLPCVMFKLPPIKDAGQIEVSTSKAKQLSQKPK